MKNLLYTEPYFDWTSGELIFTITLPLLGLENEFNGVIAADIAFTKLLSILDIPQLSL